MSREKTEFAEFFRDMAGVCAALVVGLAGGGGPAMPAPQHQVLPFTWRRSRSSPALVTAGRFCQTDEQPAPASARWRCCRTGIRG